MDVKGKLKAIIRPLYYDDNVLGLECRKCENYSPKQCSKCRAETEADYLIKNGVTVKENIVVMESPPIPTIDEVKEAAVIIKNFCISRNQDPETDCVKCPIWEMCDSDPYMWEV